MHTLCACSRAGLSETATFRHNPHRSALAWIPNSSFQPDRKQQILDCSHPCDSGTTKVTQQPLSKHAIWGLSSVVPLQAMLMVQRLRHKAHTTKHQSILCPSCMHAQLGPVKVISSCSVFSHFLFVSHHILPFFKDVCRPFPALTIPLEE